LLSHPPSPRKKLREERGRASEVGKKAHLTVSGKHVPENIPCLRPARHQEKGWVHPGRREESIGISRKEESLAFCSAVKRSQKT